MIYIHKSLIILFAIVLIFICYLLSPIGNTKENIPPLNYTIIKVIEENKFIIYRLDINRDYSKYFVITKEGYITGLSGK